MFEGWEGSVHQFNLWLTGFSHSSKQQSPEILRSGGQDDLPQHGVSDEQERKYFTLCAGMRVFSTSSTTSLYSSLTYSLPIWSLRWWM